MYLRPPISTRTDTLSLHDALPISATTIEVAHDVAHVVFRRFDFDAHDRFEDHRIGLGATVLECHRRGDAERDFAGVDVVVGTVEQRDLDVHDRRSEEHTSELQSLMRIPYAVFCLKTKKELEHS